MVVCATRSPLCRATFRSVGVPFLQVIGMNHTPKPRFRTVCKDRSDRSLNEVSRSVPVRSVETTLLTVSARALHPGTAAAGGIRCCCCRDSGDENHPAFAAQQARLALQLQARNNKKNGEEKNDNEDE